MKESLEERISAAPEWQIETYDKLKKQLPEFEILNDNQKRYLLWLCGTDNETIKTFESIFNTIRETK